MTDNKSLSYLMDIDKNNKAEFSEIKDKIDSISTSVGDTLGPVKDDISQLVDDINTKVDDMKVTVDASPAGIPAPPLLSMSAQSTENGIEVTYQAALVFGRSSNAFVIEDQDNIDQIFSTTKGVMIRYSNESYPLTPKDGILATVDEDIYTLNADTGVKTAKSKTYEIVGLTSSETYYISAFPYSSNYVYQEAASSNHKNRVKCQWTGTKGTLMVNVTQDYNYKTLGEYTVTMTPIAGGEAITKTQSGATTIVFSGLEAGEYTLSFTDFAGFIKPVDQTITVIAGQSQIKDANYLFDPELDDLTFEEIQTIVRDGRASEFLSIGQEKTTTINLKTIDASDYSSITESNVTKYDNAHVVLVGFNIFGSNEAVFMSKGMAMKARGNSDDSWLENKLKDYLNEKRSEIFPDAFPYMKNVTIKTCNYSYTGGSHWAPDYNSETGDNTFNCYISPLSAFNLNAVTLTSSDYNEGGIFPYFTNGKRRILSKTDTEDYGDYYRTRSLSFDSDYRIYRQYCVYASDGNVSYYTQSMDTLSYYPLFFVIG